MSKDYSAYEQTKSEDAMAKLAELAGDQLRAEKDVAEAMAALSNAQEMLRDIAETQIPELMDQLGIEEFTTTNGIKIKVAEKIRASILANNQRAAYRWLRENNNGALIKRELKLKFGMGEDEMAQDALNRLEGLPVEDKESVHNSTLVAFATEMLRSGKDLPEDMFSIHRQRFTKVKTK